MRSTSSVPGPVTADAAAVRLDAERMQVYQVAIAFQAATARLVPKGHGVLRDQLERASVSIVLNTAEGAGRRSRRDKARFYTIARGSALESAALLDLLLIRELAPADDCRHTRSQVVRIVQMLTKLQQRLGP